MGKVIAHYLKTKGRQAIESNKPFWSEKTYSKATGLRIESTVNLGKGEIRL